MSLDLSKLSSLDPSTMRQMVISFLSDHVADIEDGAGPQAREIVEGWDDATIGDVRDCLKNLGQEIKLYTAHPGCRRVSRAWANNIITASTVEGDNHLKQSVASGPTIIICNHLSYFDTTGTDVALFNAGLKDIANNIFALAGPKVYSDLFRRYAASCLNTLPVPQSTQFSHTARINPRELAKQTHTSKDLASNLANDGFIPLLYAEGSRSRDGRLQPFLKAVHRYLKVEGMHVVPAAILGSWQVMPVGSGKLHRAPISLQFGPRISVDEHGSRHALQLAHDGVASLLPKAHKPS